MEQYLSPVLREKVGDLKVGDKPCLVTWGVLPTASIVRLPDGPAHELARCRLSVTFDERADLRALVVSARTMAPLTQVADLAFGSHQPGPALSTPAGDQISAAVWRR